MIMTTPGTILFAYFYDDIFADLDQAIVFLVDDISFMNHAMLFFISFISIRKFRKTILSLICFARRSSDLKKETTFSLSSRKI